MGAPFRAQRILVVALVLALHSVIWMALVAVTRLQRIPTAASNVVSTMLLLDPPSRFNVNPPAPTRSERLRPSTDSLSTLPQIELLTPSLALPDTRENPSVDWEQAGRAAAASVLENHKTFGMSGALPSPSTTPESMFSAPSHHKGDQVRDDNGDVTVWTNDHCYITDRAPIPNVPEHMINPIPVCLPQPRAIVPKDAKDLRRALDERITSPVP